MFMRKLRKDRRGLSLVELICAAAILGIITATIGGAMVVATHSYRNGTVEAALQQESQFTINAIEALIIDATDTVEYYDGVDDDDVPAKILKIANVDYTYEIYYYVSEKTLRYKQYDTNTGVVVGDGARPYPLLAEHVAYFKADTSRFADARNVGLELTLENEDRSFSTKYNITSRNNPDAGTPIELSASIDVIDHITMEPNQVYVLPVAVYGSASPDLKAEIYDREGRTVEADTKATPVDGGVEIRIGTMETGGDDAVLHLHIETVATDAGLAPLDEAEVEVRIRRVTGISFNTVTPVSGTPLKTGAQYTVTATAIGAVGGDSRYFPQEPVPFEAGEYKNPDVFLDAWWFTTEGAADGSGADYAEVVNVDNSNKTLTFRLKKDITEGMELHIWARAAHPAGGAYNKTGLVYGDVYDDAVLEYVSSGITLPSDLRRGIEGYAAVDLDPRKLVEDEWARNHPGEESPYRGGFSGNVYFRYISTDGLDYSTGYPAWKQMADQGMQMTQLKFNAGDFINMYLMKDYTLEILYSFRYDNGSGQSYYPETAYTNNSGVPIPDFGLRGNSNDDQYIYKFPLQGFGLYFSSYRDAGTGGSWDTFTAIDSQYKKDGGLGIGTASNPIKFKFGSDVQIRTSSVSGAAANRGPQEYLYQNGVHLYKLVNGGWTQVNGFSCREYNKSGLDTSTLYFEPQNRQMERNVTYRLELTQIKNTDRNPNILEDYASEPVLGQGGRGVIYFMLTN